MPLLKTTGTIEPGILESIGRTPLVRFDRYLGNQQTELFVKLEAFNPGGSAKDRPAKRMLEEAMRRGQVDADTTVIESSSGNMGIGLAQVCRYYGMNFICVVDPRAQPQNIAIIEALGGQIDVVTEPFNGDLLAARIIRVRKLLEQTAHSYWPNQYANLDNPRSHFDGAVREIVDALDGEFDYLFVAISSTGTARGCRDYLHSYGSAAKVIAVDSMGSVLLGGTSGPRRIPGLGAGTVPSLARGESFDGIARVTDLDCVVGCRRAAKKEALLVGGSAGGVLESVRRMQADLIGKRCVAILHDSGTRYLATIFNDQWVSESLDCTPGRLQELTDEDPLDLRELGAV